MKRTEIFCKYHDERSYSELSKEFDKEIEKIESFIKEDITPIAKGVLWAFYGTPQFNEYKESLGIVLK